MMTTSKHLFRSSTIVVAAISICLVASACHSTASATSGAKPSLSTASVPAAGVSATPDTSTSDPAAPDTTAPDATASADAAVAGGCLISPQEASTAFGHSIGAGSGNASTCSYQSSGGILTIFATSYGGNSTTAFNTQRESATGLPGFQDVSGVGDHAFVNLDSPMSQIEFVKGSTVVVIQAGISSTPSVDVMTTLGQAAAGRV